MRGRSSGGDTSCPDDISITDGLLVLRRQRPDDLEMHLSAIDEDQIDWLWEPGDRARWEAMTAAEQRMHQARHLQNVHDGFGPGPKWTFSVDGPNAPYAVYIDCDLANDRVPAGQANISYACHPTYRSRGWTTRAVRLACTFLRDYTSATHAHLIIDEGNLASLGVARSVGAAEIERFQDEHGRTMIRHVIHLADTDLAAPRSAAARSTQVIHPHPEDASVGSTQGHVPLAPQSRLGALSNDVGQHS